jgi:hypothetical protein
MMRRLATGSSADGPMTLIVGVNSVTVKQLVLARCQHDSQHALKMVKMREYQQKMPFTPTGINGLLKYSCQYK